MESVYAIKITKRGYALTRNGVILAYYMRLEHAETALARVTARAPIPATVEKKDVDAA